MSKIMYWLKKNKMLVILAILAGGWLYLRNK
jgi:hypothetical protein